MNIERLEWDSRFFRLEVGSSHLDDKADAESIKQLLAESQFDVVYLFADQPSEDRLRQIQCIAPLYDRKLTFKKKVIPLEPTRGHDVIRFDQPLNADLLELALMSGEYSRFNLDTRFQPYFKRLYQTWIEKSLSGEMADAVYVVRSARGLKGFVTLSKKAGIGQIGLIAVHPEARGQGVATALMHYADEWYVKQDCSEAIVVTQRKNLPACRLYKKSGYNLNSETAIFHWWR